MTTIRGVHSLFYTILIPAARYAYPVIIPTLLILNVGWLEIGHYLERWTRLDYRVKFLVYFLLFLSLDIAAILSLVHFYSMK